MRTPTARRPWRALLLALGCLFAVTWTVAGCSLADAPALPEAKDVRKEQLVGSWGDGYGSDLTLREDGTFAAQKLRTSFTPGEGAKSLGKELVAGEGRWSFGDYGAGPEVNINFTGGGVATLKVVEKDKVKVLSAWVGDGESVLLTKPAAVP
ncbi:hypothetical protein ACWGDE_28830 [Streptomyces sp. NPDC054956]